MMPFPTLSLILTRQGYKCIRTLPNSGQEWSNGKRFLVVKLSQNGEKATIVG